MMVNFINKGVEIINLPRILHPKDVFQSLPFTSNTKKKKLIPSINYSYVPPIRSKILNYCKVLKEFNIEDGPMFPTCNCEYSEFKDPYHNHVITGNLNIVKNQRLRELLSKGCGHRENTVINWKKVKKEVFESLIKLTNEYSKKLCISKSHFDNFGWKVMEHVKRQIKVCRQKYPSKKYIPALKDSAVLKELSELHNQFVLVPVDKASKNVAIICKSFYFQIIHKELQSETIYKHLPLTNEEEIIQSHLRFTNQFNCGNIVDFNKLPLIYMIPKFHKKPIKFRFIVASRKCSTTPLSSAIGKALSEVRKQRKFYCAKMEKYDGINRYWVIESNEPVLNCIKNLNSTKSAQSVTTYDFSSLYTALPHEEILHCVSEMIDDVFKYRKKKNLPALLAVYKSKKDNRVWSRACWVRKPGPNTFYFDNQSLKEAIEFQLNNTYFKFGGQIYKQNVGVPMGTNDGPELANGCLHQKEFKYLNKLKKENIYRARSLKLTFRFIDDVGSFQVGDEILKICRKIYGDQLQLNKENEGTLSANVLILSFKINERCIVTDLYDKRRDFDFDIVQFPDLHGCIPSKPAYGLVMSQLLRYYNICSSDSAFVKNTVLLLSNLLNKGFQRKLLMNKVEQFLMQMKPIKYPTTVVTIIESIQNSLPSDFSVAAQP